MQRECSNGFAARGALAARTNAWAGKCSTECSEQW